MSERTNMSELPDVQLTTEEVELGIPQKAIIFLSWLLIETIGNGFLVGLIQFDIFAGDPLKRRITDQVIHSCITDMYSYCRHVRTSSDMNRHELTEMF